MDFKIIVVVDAVFFIQKFFVNLDYIQMHKHILGFANIGFVPIHAGLSSKINILRNIPKLFCCHYYIEQ